MQLNPIPIDARRFSRAPSSLMLVADHSDICALRDFKGWDRLYDDACDVGIALRNPQTGVTTRWYMDDEKFDREGDLEATVFKPCPETLRTQPQLAGWEVHIVND